MLARRPNAHFQRTDLCRKEISVAVVVVGATFVLCFVDVNNKQTHATTCPSGTIILVRLEAEKILVVIIGTISVDVANKLFFVKSIKQIGPRTSLIRQARKEQIRSEVMSKKRATTTTTFR